MYRPLGYVFAIWVLSGAAGFHGCMAAPLTPVDGKMMDVVLAGQLISGARAAAEARSVVGGRVLAVHLVNTDGRAIYQVRLLVGGQVRIVRIDAHDGRLLR